MWRPEVGKSIGHDDSLYTIMSVQEEENKTFRWFKITAKWTHFGRHPRCALVKTLLVGRHRKDETL